MAGSVRFESTSGSPEDLAFSGGYSNGQRGNYSIERSGSFREGSEGRIFGSTSTVSRGGATTTGEGPAVLQSLTLDPITMGDQKYTRLGELRRVLGISFGTTAEDNFFGAAHTKPPSLVTTEELKRFKSLISDSMNKARGRAKKFEDSINKLNKHSDISNSKKQQRNELLTNERPSGLNLLKMGTLMQRNPDLLAPRLEERNRRVRSSVAETRAEGRSNIAARQSVSIVKDRDMLKDGSELSNMVEEKVRRLPAGGEGWERKMKRKRSVGTVLSRPVDNDGELKRVMHHKLSNESGLLSCDAQSFRSGSCNGANGINRSDNASVSATLNVRSIPKMEMEKVTLSRDIRAGSNKERIKGTDKLNLREASQVLSPGSFTKGKASRAPRSGSVASANSSPNIPRPLEGDGWEQPHSLSKVNSAGGAINRKRPMPAGSSSPPITQWVGQRQQKSSRSRRANLVSPISNLDEGQISEGCTPDSGSRMTPVGTNGGLLAARSLANGTQQFRVKQEIVSSPARLSEFEDAGENQECRSKEKGLGSNEADDKVSALAQSVGTPALHTKKNKILIKEESVDGLQKQGRSARGSSYSRSSISPMREKLEIQSSSKPLKISRTGSDKSGSKSGRPPLKKLSDRKVLSRVVHTSLNGSPDLPGESEDDREELLAAANSARNSRYLARSSTFWKKMEPLFASVSLEDVSNLKQELQSTDDYHESISRMSERGDGIMGNLMCEDFLPQTLLSGEERSLPDQIQSKWPARMPDLGDQVQANGDSTKDDTPLYQRILSALIVEDETDELKETRGRYLYSRDASPGITGYPVDVESRKRDRIDFEYDSMFSQVQKHGSLERLSCNGDTAFNVARNLYNLYSDELSNGGNGFIHGDLFSEFAENGGNESRKIHSNAIAIDRQYEQASLQDKLMLELRSIGLYLESVPDLADREDETITQEIAEIQKLQEEQVVKKKEYLNKILKAVEEVKEREGRDLEQVAMDRLVELAYKKKLATRGSNASKSGVAKVSKQVAMAFMKRTLARCRKFEETGKSCFTEPAIRDVLFAAPPREVDIESTKITGLTSRSGAEQLGLHEGGIYDGFPSDQDFAKTGPIFNRARKRELLLDDVGGSGMRGNAKGKRSERDSSKSGGRGSGERKVKSKPKQKSGGNNKLLETRVNPPPPSHPPHNDKKKTDDVKHFDLMDQLGGEHQDLSNFLSNLNEEELGEEPLMGLEIPLDDIADLNMF